MILREITILRAAETKYHPGSSVFSFVRSQNLKTEKHQSFTTFLEYESELCSEAFENLMMDVECILWKTDSVYVRSVLIHLMSILRRLLFEGLYKQI